MGVRDFVVKSKGGVGSSSDCCWWGSEEDGDEVWWSMIKVIGETESRVLDGGVVIVVICIKRILTMMMKI